MQTEQVGSYAYVAICKCGAIRAALVEDDDLMESLPRFCSEQKKKHRGYIVKRVAMPIEFGECTCKG